MRESGKNNKYCDVYIRKTRNEDESVRMMLSEETDLYQTLLNCRDNISPVKLTGLSPSPKSGKTFFNMNLYKSNSDILLMKVYIY